MVKSKRGKSNKGKKTNPLHKLMDLEKFTLTLLVGGLLVFVGYHAYQYFKRSSESFEDVVIVSPEQSKEETKMVNVDAENETLTDGSVVEIVFCKMEGCGHCVKFNDNVWESPEVQKLHGTKCPRGVLKLKVVDPNHEYSKDVDGFPTIKKIINGTTVSTFEDERTVEAFTAWCKSE